jgi:hypothetical protein
VDLHLACPLCPVVRVRDWTMRKTDSERLKAFKMTSQRRILSIKWQDHITYSTIKARTGSMDLPFVVADRCHSLFSHICRLSPDTPAHRALSLGFNVSVGAQPAEDWKRPTGRPRWTWLQQLKKIMGRKLTPSTLLDGLCWNCYDALLVTHRSE